MESIEERIKLNESVEIPKLGLGVYQIPKGRASVDAVSYALKIGYRLIDTAAIYGNESEVGKAVRDSGIAREEIFVTTKLWNSEHGYEKALRAFDGSLKRLGLDFVDLYLIHWPESRRDESWRALVELKKQGKCRTIGVSNYMINHLEELLQSSDIVPTVNQVEFNPFLYQKDLLAYCEKKKIQLEAYSPLARAARIRDPRLKEVAEKHSKTPAQIMIRWCLQHNVIPIPKSSNPKRIEENMQVFDFELSPKDMKVLDSLDEDLHENWDPTH
ncbi:MAG: aldo/keto reductase [Nitrososphaerales archaeon]